ncbi:MAG: XdhC family protein [Desulfoplanes sp.]
MHDFFQTIVDRLSLGETVVLATIVRQEGSTPRDAGTMMAVFAGGSISGTIGGGFAEAEVMRAGRVLMQHEETCRSIRTFSLTDGKSASSMGMVCGGDIDVLLTRLDGSAVSVLQRVMENIAQEKTCFLVFPLGDDFSGCAPVIMVDDSAAPCVEDMDFATISAKAGIPPCPVRMTCGGMHFFVNPAMPAPRVYFFGAGHVSRATALYAAQAGFAPVIVDDRKELATRELFSFAHAIHCLASFHDCVASFALERADLVVIASRVPLLDNVLLEQVLHTSAGFVGMLGSVKKRDAIFADLLTKGIAQDDLDRVHCPIGIPIGARTPQEIGVSIVAELIKARRAGL